MLKRHEVDLVEKGMLHEARESFLAYRRLMHPGQLEGWWQELITLEFQRFYDDFDAGKRPVILIESPPQHGKSTLLIDFASWVLGKRGSIRIIYASFSYDLGVRANHWVRRLVEKGIYSRIFPNVSKPEIKTQRNLVLGESEFRNTTVRGAVTGQTMDIGLIDDLVKSRGESASPMARQRTWEWLAIDYMSRLSRTSGLAAVMTRWHIDDPMGRLQESLGERMRVISFPAIAEEDEKYRKAGEALFPELKPLDFLLERKGLMSNVAWSAVYQQRPMVEGGEVIHPEWFRRYDEVPELETRIITADTANKTARHNDYTVLQLWGLSRDGKMYLLDQRRGKWEAPELVRAFLKFWNDANNEWVPEVFGRISKVGIEDAASGTSLIQTLRTTHGVPITPILRHKDKYTRLLDVLNYIESGQVLLPRKKWADRVIDECVSFSPSGGHIHDDQLDAMVDGIQILSETIRKRKGWERFL